MSTRYLDPHMAFINRQVLELNWDALGRYCRIVKDSRVSQQADTKVVIDSKSSARHPTKMLAKWRPPGRATNRRMSDRIPPPITRQRAPVNFGDVDGRVDVSASSSPSPIDISERASREGKEQMKLKTSEDGMELWMRRRDSRDGNNACNGTRDTRLQSHTLASTVRLTMLRKVQIQVCAIVVATMISRRLPIERSRV